MKSETIAELIVLVVVLVLGLIFARGGTEQPALLDEVLAAVVGDQPRGAVDNKEEMDT